MHISRTVHYLGSRSAGISLQGQTGVTLFELVVFIVVVSIALGTLFSVFNQSMINSVDPLIRVRALECAQAKLDEIIARKFDQNTPTGGVPACGSAEIGASACAGILGGGGFDDIGDYDGQNFVDGDCNVDVTVSGGDSVRLVTVTSVMPDGNSIILSTYRTNF